MSQQCAVVVGSEGQVKQINKQLYQIFAKMNKFCRIKTMDDTLSPLTHGKLFRIIHHITIIIIIIIITITKMVENAFGYISLQLTMSHEIHINKEILRKL